LNSLPVRADRRLGQHFLVDRNVLSVIERLAELDQDDVVLEVGPGLGILTERLAELTSHVHAIEIDEQLRPHLDERLHGRTNVTVRYEDAMTADLVCLDPAPSKLVANLPYSIATPLLMESAHTLPHVKRWCVMVQREVADRIFAEPATRAYGAVSVMLQLTAGRAGFHPVARTCFNPVPNVDSALVSLSRERIWGEEYGSLRRLVGGAFSHRRKTLVNSLDLATDIKKHDAVAGLHALGRQANVRAEELVPEEFIALRAALDSNMP
jgi:16S rRNA (adenine1518-N6/adenine1519-N6)-dimethyltransferase